MKAVIGLAVVAMVAAGFVLPPRPQATTITVYKSPTCGCCKEWITHMRSAGFTVDAQDVKDVGPIKNEKGVPVELWSCHTAIANGYIIEGHVPADLVQKFLKEKPAVMGLAVPEMPAGSPGMEVAGKEPYDVFAFDKNGKTKVYARR